MFTFLNLDWIINLYLKLNALKELIPYETREIIDLEKNKWWLTFNLFKCCSNYNEKK